MNALFTPLCIIMIQKAPKNKQEHCVSMKVYLPVLISNNLIGKHNRVNHMNYSI